MNKLLIIFLVSIALTSCGGGKGGNGSSVSSLNAPLSVASSFMPDNYFVEYQNYEGTSDTVFIAFTLMADYQFKSLKIRFINGSRNMGYYQIKKGTYYFSTPNVFQVTFNKVTCGDLTPHEFGINGTPRDTIFLKMGAVTTKLYSDKSWSPGFNTNDLSTLIEDIKCEKF